MRDAEDAEDRDRRSAERSVKKTPDSLSTSVDLGFGGENVVSSLVTLVFSGSGMWYVCGFCLQVCSLD